VAQQSIEVDLAPLQTELRRRLGLTAVEAGLAGQCAFVDGELFDVEARQAFLYLESQSDAPDDKAR
jgi:hypothetical protein